MIPNGNNLKTFFLLLFSIFILYVYLLRKIFYILVGDVINANTLVVFS